MDRLALTVSLVCLSSFALVAGCGHRELRRSRAIAHEDGQRVIAALESYNNEHGVYPPSLATLDLGGSRVASMLYVRDGDGFTLVVGASSTRHGASCTRHAGDTDWDCQRQR
jgi:hypothetical protein